MAAFSNRATLTYSGGSAVSNVVTGEILDVLSATKTAVGSTYRAGDTVTYVVSLTNSGASSLTGITLSDDLGAYPFGTGTLTPLTYVEGSLLTYVNGVLTDTAAVTAGPPLLITGIEVPAGGDTVIVYRATLNEYAPIGAGGTVENTATVTGAGLTEAVVATETVSTVEEAALSLFKELTPTTVPENGEITYTLTLSNSGNAAVVATDDLSVSDTFDPILSDITVTLDGAALTAGTDYTYDETTGLFSTTPGRITLPAATVTQDPVSGAYAVTPGTATLTVTGRI